MVMSVKIDDTLKNRIQHLAGIRHRSTYWIMREAIREYVDREEAREKFKQEALLAWKNFQETGLYLTQQEVCDWLDTWSTDKEKEPPKCHK